MQTEPSLLPIVVDLDGTLIHSDMLVESLAAVAASAPRTAITALWQSRTSMARLKRDLAKAAPIDVQSLPYNQALLAWLHAQKNLGRPIYLASASHATYVQAIADHLGFFAGSFASDGITNLKSDAKAAALCAAFGEGKFDYVGNAPADIAVWKKQRTSSSPVPAARLKQRFCANFLGRPSSPHRVRAWEIICAHCAHINGLRTC